MRSTVLLKKPLMPLPKAVNSLPFLGWFFYTTQHFYPSKKISLELMGLSSSMGWKPVEAVTLLKPPLRREKLSKEMGTVCFVHCPSSTPAQRRSTAPWGPHLYRTCSLMIPWGAWAHGEKWMNIMVWGRFWRQMTWSKHPCTRKAPTIYICHSSRFHIDVAFF
jgi:hypothetical protein